MQPVGNSSSGIPIGKCQETSSKCVIWDGPNINCLGVNLCKGQSIEVIVYNTAAKLCEVLDALNISPVDLACLAPPPGAALPDTPNQLFELIINKLCELNQDVIDLQNNGAAPVVVPLPDCNQLFNDCPPGTTLEYQIPDPNNPLGPPITVTQLVLIDNVNNTSPAVAYLASKICELLCRMGNAESDIAVLQAQVTQILNQIGGALPSVDVPTCISPVSPIPIANPNDPSDGAIPAIATLLCDIVTNITDDPNGPYPMDTKCNGAELSTLPAYGSYPGQAINTMADLGVIPSPQYLWQTVNNIMIALCDLRNFAQVVKSTCCPTLCANIAVDIGAVIPGPLPPAVPNRAIVRFFLNGSFLDVVTNNTINSSFGFAAFTPPGYSIGGPAVPPPVGPQWDIHYPVNITITDSDSPANTYTNNTFFLDQFAAANSFQDLNVGATLDITTDYTVTYSVTVAAPDGTFCTFTDTAVLLTTCDNLPVNTVTVSQIGASGFTIDFVQPAVSAPTELVSYTIIITESGPGGAVITLPDVPPGWSTYYIYPSEIDYPGIPVPPYPGDQWVLTSDIQENTTYNVTVTAVYNCGTSIPVGAPGSFTTLVALEIDISNLVIGSECVNPSAPGYLTLLPPSPLPPGAAISDNFTVPIQFDGINPAFALVSATPGLIFNYMFETLALKSSDWDASNVNLANCNTVPSTRCWGQVTSANYYPGSSFNTFTSPGLVTSFQKEGCYDYIISNFSFNNITPGIGTELTITNINDGSGAGINNSNHGTYTYSYTAPPTAITMPTTNAGLTITNSAHSINGGLRPSIKIIIDDPSNYVANAWTMWYGISAQGEVGIDPQSIDAVQHTNLVQQRLNAAAIARPVDKWTAGAGTNDTPVPLPIFMRIAVYKWNGSGYVPPVYPTTTANASNGIIDVTPYWIGLPNITTTGYEINLPAYGFNIGLRDKIEISFTGGVYNDNSNPDYPAGGANPVLTTDVVASSVTIEQDPFAGVFPDPTLITGPFAVTGPSPITLANGVSYDDAINGNVTVRLIPLDARFGVPLNNDLNITSAPSTTAIAYTQPCTFVISGDMTITWSVG